MNFTLQIYDLFAYGIPGLALYLLATRAWAVPVKLISPTASSATVNVVASAVIAFAAGVVICPMVGHIVQTITGLRALFRYSPAREEKTSGLSGGCEQSRGIRRQVWDCWCWLWIDRRARQFCRGQERTIFHEAVAHMFGSALNPAGVYRCCRSYLMNFYPETHFQCERQWALRGFCLNMVATSVPLGWIVGTSYGAEWGILAGLAWAVLLVRRGSMFFARALEIAYGGCYVGLRCKERGSGGL